MTPKSIFLVQDASYIICNLFLSNLFIRLKGSPLFNGKTKKELYMLNKAANISLKDE